MSSVLSFCKVFVEICTTKYRNKYFFFNQNQKCFLKGETLLLLETFVENTRYDCLSLRHTLFLIEKLCQKNFLHFYLLSAWGSLTMTITLLLLIMGSPHSTKFSEKSHSLEFTRLNQIFSCKSIPLFTNNSSIYQNLMATIKLLEGY